MNPRKGPAMTEKDPNGTPPHHPGAKGDAGKTRAGLVLGGFARALLEVSAVGTFGATKYTPDGWVSVPNGIERYTDAMHRHLLAEATGERLDGDSGLAHAAHAAWCALARLDLMLRAGQEQSLSVPYIGPDRRACCNDLSDMVRAGKSVAPEDVGACGNVGREAC